jgi:hypothetical protein
MSAQIQLKPMNQQQFDAFVKDSTEEYARVSPHYRAIDQLPFVCLKNNGDCHTSCSLK